MKIINGKPGRFRDWLLVLGIIFFLFLIFGPVGTSFGTMVSARRAAAQASLRAIALSYADVAAKNPAWGNSEFKPSETSHALAIKLAKDANLNDASLWVVKTDLKLNGESIPRSVLMGGTEPREVDPAFAKLALSYEFAVNFPANAPSFSTPLAWTRGLRADGTWAPDSPWQGAGGHIAYLDGHVEWFEKLQLTQGYIALVKYGTATPTVNIREALPPGAIILSAEPNLSPSAKP